MLVLCGPGDNGGDGFVAAELLRAAGWPVNVAAMAAPSRSEASAAAAKAWGGETLALARGAPAKGGLVIDALFGAGLSRALPGDAAAALRKAVLSGAEIVAVDVPSGLDADRGSAPGEAFPCMLTVSFQLRPAHLLQPGRALCGEVVVAEIGAPPVGQLDLWENTPALWAARWPWPQVSAHKMQRGRLVVVSGGPSQTGAARLAARAGLRIGAGLVTVLSPQEALLVNAVALEAVMVRAFDTEAELLAGAEHADAVVIGPGAGVTEATADNVLALAQTGAALIVDADALTVFRDDPGELFAALDRDDVLTPHPGEFERVFPGLLAKSPERITAARKAAVRAGSVVVLKGARHGDRRARRALCDQRQRRTLARHRGLGRYPGGGDRGPGGAGDGEFRGGLRGRMGACGGRRPLRPRPDRRRPARPSAPRPEDAPRRPRAHPMTADLKRLARASVEEAGRDYVLVLTCDDGAVVRLLADDEQLDVLADLIDDALGTATDD